MNYIKSKLQTLDDNQKGGILLTIGILLGILSAYLLKDFHWGNIELLNPIYLDLIKNTEVDSKMLLNYVHIKNFKYFIIFWLGCLTPVSIPFIVLTVIFIGFQASFFLMIVILEYGVKGIPLVLGYSMPHYIIYGVIAYICLRLGRDLYYSISQSLDYGKKHRIQMALRVVFVILVMSFILIVGGYSESYLGSKFLKYILSIFSY